MIKVVIFDLDDTLISEMEYVHSGFRAVAEYLEQTYGLDGVFENLIRLMKEDKKLVFNRLLDAKKIPYSANEMAKIVERYKMHEPKISFFPDVLPTIDFLKLHNIKCAVLTDGSFLTQKLKIKAVDGENIFEEILYTDQLGREYWKPSSKGFEILKEKFQVDYEEILYVGDNPQKDFFISKIYPVHTVRIMREGALYENEEYLEGIQEEYRIKDFRELVDILQELGATICEEY